MICESERSKAAIDSATSTTRIRSRLLVCGCDDDTCERICVMMCDDDDDDEDDDDV
jgi:hypothetical protein